MCANNRTIEEQFMAWLAQNAPARFLSELYLCYPEIERHCLRIKVLKKPLFETTDLVTVKKVQKTITESRIFQFTHKKQMKKMVSAVQYYMTFVKEYNAEQTIFNQKGDTKQLLQDAAQQTPIPEVQEEDVGAKADMVSFDGLLAEDRYADLREALLSDGISSVEILKSINLWSFMNSHSLYSIQQRLIISTELTGILRNAGKHNTSAVMKYEIHYNNEIYSGDTPSEAFVSFMTTIAAKYPLKFRGLISSIHPKTTRVVVHRHDYDGSKLRLMNPEVFIDSDLTREQMELYVAWVLERCTVSPLKYSIAEAEPPDAPKKIPVENEESDEDEETSDEPDYIPKVFPLSTSYFTQKAEDYLLGRNLAGATYDELKAVLQHTMVGTKEAVSLSPHIVEMNRLLYHDEAFVDFEEGADALEDILDKLLKKNKGIATATQLYEYARSEMSMFLNDNGIIGQQVVYDLARHLFEKLEYHGKRYFFRSNIYISLPEILTDSNNSIMQKYAREKGTIVTFKEMESYLKGLGLNSDNPRSVMRIDKEPIFLIYQENEYLLAELIHMDDAFFGQVKTALKHLFEDVGDHIIIRHISGSWYNLLPTLPALLEWTPMLLQQLLHYYSKELGARTVSAMDSQNSNTLHAMLVDNDSWIQDFRDAVAVFLHDEMQECKSFGAEELRKILVDAGMISGKQLIRNMHKALGGDPRFLWDGDGNKVNVRI